MILRLRVGGLTLALHSTSSTPALALPRRYRPFVPNRGSDIRLELLESDVPAVDSSSDLLFDSGALWRAYRHGDGLLYAFRSNDASNPLARVLVIDQARRQGKLFIPPSHESKLRGYALSYPLDEILFQHHAAARGFLVVHACGVAFGDGALLFCGESGAGKSTTASLWRRHHRGTLILSDDRMLVREYRNRLWAFGTPWHGSGRFASPEGRQLAAIFFLARDTQTRIEPMPEPAAAAQLFARTFPPMWEPAVVGGVLAACSRVSREASCYTLYFRPDRSAVQAVLTHLRD